MKNTITILLIALTTLFTINVKAQKSNNTDTVKIKTSAQCNMCKQRLEKAMAYEKGVKSSTKLYNAIYVITRPLFPLMRKMNSITTSSRLGQAMINSVLHGFELKHLENPEINILAKIK